MPTVSLTDIVAGPNVVSVYNANNTTIETALAACISADGTGTAITGNLDLNSNKIINLADGVNPQDAVTQAQLQAASVATDVPSQTGNNNARLGTDGTSLSWSERFVPTDISASAILGTNFRNGFLLCTNAITLNLPDSSGVDDGWTTTVKNNNARSSGTIVGVTTSAGSDTLDGVTNGTWYLFPGEQCTFVNYLSEWHRTHVFMDTWGARVYKTSNQSVDTSTLAAITWDSEEYDDLGFHDVGSNTDRITIPANSGITEVEFSAAIVYDANATGKRRNHILLNNVVDLGDVSYQDEYDVNSATNYHKIHMRLRQRVTAGDYLTAVAFQSSGGALDVFGFASPSQAFADIYVTGRSVV